MACPVYMEYYKVNNAISHHTKDFENVSEGALVLRRGQVFTINIRFRERLFDLNKDRLILYFDFGKSPSVPKGTKGLLRVNGPNRGGLPAHQFTWHTKDVRLVESDDLMLEIYIPANVPVGLWKCYGEAYYSDGQERPRFEKVPFTCEQPMYVLFNPWCQDDVVYMADEMWREECILNESGIMWGGTCKSTKGRCWVYGQFDKVILPSCEHVLSCSGIDDSQRGDPVEVCRIISQMVNSSDDDGIVQPCWDGNYKDGTTPAKWTGSCKILEEYKSTGWKPVKYGQCWVFAGMVTTICRALGIPCRPVTNFISAHDTNKTLTVDKYFDVFGEKIEGGPAGDVFDSVWNYHVWNECYMRRTDLPAGNDGWQVIDATPQRQSAGMYRCGPASVKAVFRGDTGLNHDTGFVFSEVNADILHWQEDEQSDWGFSLLKCLKYKIGAKILTKLPDKLIQDKKVCYEDIVHSYKPKEGTHQERLAVLTAMRGSQIFQQYMDQMKKLEGCSDVLLDLSDIEAVPIGDQFIVTLKMKNTSDDPRTVAGTITVNAIDYTETRSVLIKKDRVFMELVGQQETEILLYVKPEDYIDKMIDDNIKVYAVMSVKETHQMWCEEDDLVIEKPSIKFETQEVPKLGQQCDITLKILNPLDIPLTNCLLAVEAPGLMPRKSIDIQNIEPKRTEFIREKMLPVKLGEKRIVATFSSSELQDISGTFSVNVVE